MAAMEKKSLFMPADIDEKKIQPLALGDSFGWYPKQGFYGSGKYYLWLQDYYKNNDGIIVVHIIDFNKEELKYERKKLRIKIPETEGSSKRNSELDFMSGKLVHTVERALKKKGKKELVLEIYYINMVDFINMDDFDEITIQKKKSDLRIIYDSEQYNELVFNLYNHHCQKETLVLSCQAFQAEERENHQIIVSNQVCLDFVHITSNKLLLNKRVIVNLKATPGFLDYVSVPHVHCNGDRILFYQETEDGEKEILSIQEFDCDGMKSDVRKNRVRFVELKDGEMKLVDSDRIFFGEPWRGLSYRLKTSFRRLDRRLLPTYTYTSGKKLFHQFTTYDFKTKEKVTEVFDFGLRNPSYSVNWNIFDIGMTYSDKTFHGNVFFKLCRSKTRSKDLSLKHFSRFVVLTNFTEDYLLNQNLPSSVFKYLGIQK
ncbi:uncharacterized protein [Clytia hemisphaerica]|uniref:Uncharacterized protein n=1 Tax=Clytia hemisphaerica TaxID=252671 RepID=A0A7M5XGA1_9CNID